MLRENSKLNIPFNNDDTSLTDSLQDNSHLSHTPMHAPGLNDIKEINENYSENLTEKKSNIGGNR